MCPPRFIESIQSPEISRRSLLKFGLGAAVAAVATPIAAEAATATRVSFNNVADLTHLLGTQFPLFPGAAPFQITPVVFHDRDGYYGSILNY
ncbi:MAG: cyclase family protein, partial [Acidobacteria bacterium]